MHKKIGIILMLILLLTGCSDIRQQVETYNETDDYSLSKYCEYNDEVSQILNKIEEIDNRLIVIDHRRNQDENYKKDQGWEYTKVEIRDLNNDKNKQVLQLLDKTLAPGIISFADEMVSEKNKKAVSGKVFGSIIACYEIDYKKIRSETDDEFEDPLKTVDTLHIYLPNQKISDKNYQEIVKSIAEEKLVVRHISFGDESTIIELCTPEALVDYYISKKSLGKYQLPISASYQILIKDNSVYKATGVLSGFADTKIEEYSITPLIAAAKLMGSEEKELLLKPLPQSMQPIKNGSYMLNQTLRYKTSYDISMIHSSRRAIIMELKTR